MSHELEITDGQANMAYAGELPWHGLGKRVPADLTPEQMTAAAGLDWKVEMRQCFTELNGAKKILSAQALVRLPNGKNIKEESILTEPRGAWHSVQNTEAAEFFNEFISAGEMEMHTAGSLHNGRIVWFLAKIKDEFTISGGRDRVDSYMLFTNPHQWGLSTDVRHTSIRAVCWNTVSQALAEKGELVFKMSHRKKFIAEQAKEALGLAKIRMEEYHQAADFLSKKKYDGETVVDYFKRIFPLSSKPKEDSKRKAKEFSKAASTCMGLLSAQPGADFAPESWWNAFNAVTYYTDHLATKTVDTRVASAWYGHHRKVKLEALHLAKVFAEAA